MKVVVLGILMQNRPKMYPELRFLISMENGNISKFLHEVTLA